MSGSLLIGCIADDFTGASDAASFLVKAGMRTMLFNGIPSEGNHYEIDAAVIALKTRTQEKEKAVKASVEAVRWLLTGGAAHIYSKYCSTFDSTPEGNIGPILDAVLEECGERASILCPALPVNGRTVSQGRLYVNGVPLDESPMKNHPLTPMWASDISELMEPQSKYPCIKVPAEIMKLPPEEIRAYIFRKSQDKERYYLIPDYEKEEDADKIADVFGDMKVLSGGSGILTALGRKYCGGRRAKDPLPSGTDGRGIVLAGSCSEATRGQIRVFQESGNYGLKLDPARLLREIDAPEQIWKKALAESEGKEILIYSSDTPENIEKLQALGKEKIASAVEKTIAGLAALAVEDGFRRIIVAGGETSGAVTKKLGYNAYHIGESIAPGVPIMIPEEDRRIRLVLKSGNFGQPDFMLRALRMTES